MADRTSAERKQDEKSRMDDLKKEVSMDEHMVDVKTLTARLKTDTDKVRASGFTMIFIWLCDTHANAISLEFTFHEIKQNKTHHLLVNLQRDYSCLGSLRLLKTTMLFWKCKPDFVCQSWRDISWWYFLVCGFTSLIESRRDSPNADD